MNTDCPPEDKCPVIDQWELVMRPPSDYAAPEQFFPAIKGIITDSPKHADGSIIVTSRLVDIENDLARTASGSTYRLGAIHPDYEITFPNARERLLGGRDAVRD